MSTSGSTNFIQTRTEIINDAFQLLGVYGIGRTISSEDMAFAVSMLNKMVKAWGTKGLHLWDKTEAVLYLTKNVAEYTLSDASTSAYVTNISEQIITQLNGAVAASVTALTVDSTTGMTVGDHIGVVLSDKSLHWTTIATIPTSTSLTLTTGVLTAASDNTLIYTFTNRSAKPLRVLSARRVSGIDTGASSTLIELPMTSIAYEEYFDLPIKTSSGLPNQFHYNPQLLAGKMYIWPRPSDCSDRIHFTYERILDDLDAASDNFDFPQEWLECLTYQLAVRLGPAFGKDQRTGQILAPMASNLLGDLMDWDSEITSVSLMPDLDY